MGSQQVISSSARKLRKQSAGFTLVELLVALAILAFAAAVVVINAPPPRSTVQGEAEIFAAKLQLAIEKAVYSGRLVHLEIANHQYRFLVYESGEWREAPSQFPKGGEFQSTLQFLSYAQDPTLANARSLHSVFSEEQEKVLLRIDPVGGSDAFSIQLGSRDPFIVSLDTNGNLSIARGQ